MPRRDWSYRQTDTRTNVRMAEKASPSPPFPACGGRLVLFVTRDDEVGDLYVAALEAHGTKTQRVRDCSSAAALLGKDRVAAIFVDVLDEPDWAECADLARVATE